MKFWIFSDLHLEVQSVIFPDAAPQGVDAIIIAGDFCALDKIEHWSRFIMDKYDLPIVFVPGNHEYYSRNSPDRSFHEDRKFMRSLHDASKSWRRRIYVLDNGGLKFKTVRIIGSTLWTDMRMDLESESDFPWRINEAQMLVPDYRTITYKDGQKITPQDVLRVNQKAISFIKKQIAEPFNGATIVVTHHLPHPECNPSLYDGVKNNYLYACSGGAFEDVLKSENAPSAWICGHTHVSIDTKIFNTRVICNPLGYLHSDERYTTSFSWDVVLDTEAF